MEISISRTDLANSMLAHENSRMQIVDNIAPQLRDLVE